MCFPRATWDARVHPGAYGGSGVQFLELGPEKKFLNSSRNPLNGPAIAKVARTWKPLRFFRQMCR